MTLVHMIRHMGEESPTHGHIIFDVETSGAYNDRRGGCIIV